MATVDNLRNSLIEKILSITNKDYLAALHKLVDSSTAEEETIKLTKEQRIMLELSEDDIKNNRLISQAELDKADLKWLKEL